MEFCCSSICLLNKYGPYLITLRFANLQYVPYCTLYTYRLRYSTVCHASLPIGIVIRRGHKQTADPAELGRFGSTGQGKKKEERARRGDIKEIRGGRAKGINLNLNFAFILQI